MFAGRLLELCWKFAGSYKHPITQRFLLLCVRGEKGEVAIAPSLNIGLSKNCQKKILLVGKFF